MITQNDMLKNIQGCSHFFRIYVLKNILLELLIDILKKGRGARSTIKFGNIAYYIFPLESKLKAIVKKAISQPFSNLLDNGIFF